MFTRDQKIEMQRKAWEARLRGVPQFQIAIDLQGRKASSAAC